MREHMGLFRGKRIDNGEWVEGFYIAHLKSAHYIIPCRTGGYASIYHGFYVHKWYEVDPDTVGECTGLRDKNGKLIFEGDILDCKSGMYERCKVIFNEFCSAFQLMCADGFSDFFLCSIDYTEMEIIGTIHDNPKLLKGGECE